MYIEKLTKKDIKEITAKLLLLLERGDIDKVKFYLDDCKIEKGKPSIVVSFNTGYEIHSCYISDFSASVTYGYYGDDEKVKLAYRKHMYERFGNEYYNNMRDYYKKDIISRYDSELEKLSNELNEMIK